MGRKSVILELGVWPISKKLIGPLARFAHNLVGKKLRAPGAVVAKGNLIIPTPTQAPLQVSKCPGSIAVVNQGRTRWT